MFPAIGSTISAAIWPRFASKTRRTESRSLYAATSVSADAARVTPGLVGVPSVSASDPALTRNASACPW